MQDYFMAARQTTPEVVQRTPKQVRVILDSCSQLPASVRTNVHMNKIRTGIISYPARPH
jgi:hypothetical protein